jgi:hypothetical protein
MEKQFGIDVDPFTFLSFWERKLTDDAKKINKNYNNVKTIYVMTGGTQWNENVFITDDLNKLIENFVNWNGFELLEYEDDFQGTLQDYTKREVEQFLTEKSYGFSDYSLWLKVNVFETNKNLTAKQARDLSENDVPETELSKILKTIEKTATRGGYIESFSYELSIDSVNKLRNLGYKCKIYAFHNRGCCETNDKDMSDIKPPECVCWEYEDHEEDDCECDCGTEDGCDCHCKKLCNCRDFYENEIWTDVEW